MLSLAAVQKGYRVISSPAEAGSHPVQKAARARAPPGKPLGVAKPGCRRTLDATVVSKRDERAITTGAAAAEAWHSIIYI